MSDPPILVHIVCERCDGMSLTLKSITSIVLLAYISIELLPLITLTLAGELYLSQLIDDIRDILSKAGLTKDLTCNMYFHNLKIDNWRSDPRYLRSLYKSVVPLVPRLRI